MQLTLEPNDSKRLAKLCGKFDENLKQIENRLNVKIKNRGNYFQFEGLEESIKKLLYSSVVYIKTHKIISNLPLSTSTCICKNLAYQSYQTQIMQSHLMITVV